MRKEDFLKKIGLDEPYENWVFGDGDGSPFAGSWKDYVCYQPAPSPDFLCVHHIVVKQEVEDSPWVREDAQPTEIAVKLDADAPARMMIRIEKSDIPVGEYVYTEDTIEAAVLETLNSFPVVKVDNHVEYAAAWTDSVRKTKRGPPQYNIGNVWFYKGTSEVDGPLFVSSAAFGEETRYAIWKQDNFEDFGFVMG
jgi:hypothetical protein